MYDLLPWSLDFAFSSDIPLTFRSPHPVNLATEDEKAEIRRRYEEEWEKNWWARYALTWGEPDGTAVDWTEEHVMVWKVRDWHELHGWGKLSFFHELLFEMSPGEREATNYLCGRVDGINIIQYNPGVNWDESRAQNTDHLDLHIHRLEGDKE